MDHQQGFPGSLTTIPSGWSGSDLGLAPGEGFWARIEQIAVKGEMTRGLDSAMQGQPSPRIWMFLHEPGRGELSAAVAMSFARELAFRDQAVLLLDCDDRDLALTRWAGRVEAEGWIDLARYGTSVLTSGVPMPFVGRRGYLLGVGSFAPTDVTAKEIETLLTRLRRQGDDLLLVAPADSLGRLWAPAAAIRIFCWDRQTMPEQEAGAIAAEFSAAGCPLTAVATFKEAGAVEELLVDQVLSETEASADLADPSGPSEPSEPSETDEPMMPEPEEPPAAVDSGATDAKPETAADEDEVETVEKAGWRDLPHEEETESQGQGLDDGGEEEPLFEPSGSPVKETSRVFWFGALVAVVLIAAIAVYYFKFVRVPPEGHFEQIDVVSHTEAPPPAKETEASETGALDHASNMPVGADSLALDQGKDSDPGVLPEVTATDGKAAADSALAAEQTQPAIDIQDEVPVETPPAPAAEFDMGPYREPVGTGGWALHVYSLPDSAATEIQVKELDRRGFQSEIRVVDLGDKGRWRRIYLGSFSTRNEAKEAVPALSKKLRTDWAKPERFTTSAPE